MKDSLGDHSWLFVNPFIHILVYIFFPNKINLVNIFLFVWNYILFLYKCSSTCLCFIIFLLYSVWYEAYISFLDSFEILLIMSPYINICIKKGLRTCKLKVLNYVDLINLLIQMEDTFYNIQTCMVVIPAYIIYDIQDIYSINTTNS